MATYIKQALVIGNDDYIVNGRLKSCVNDATDMYKCLQMMGFYARRAKNLPMNAMRAATYQLVHSIQPGSIVMFYFSGHGLQYNGKNYLVPVNDNEISLEDIDQTTLNVQELIKNMYRKRPRLMLIILDCCRSFNTGEASDQRRGFNRRSAKIKDGLAPMQAPPATIIAFACAADMDSSAKSQNNRNSMYTYHLLNHICRPNLDIDLVLRLVAKDVEQDPLNESHQTPFRYSSCNEIICLVDNGGMNVPVSPGYLQAGAFFQPYMYQYGKGRAVRHNHSKNHAFQHRFNVPNNHRSANMRPSSNAVRAPVRPGFPFSNQFYPHQR